MGSGVRIYWAKILKMVQQVEEVVFLEQVTASGDEHVNQ